MEVLRAEGLHKVTMRRVAQALDTGPASLYVYVANTAELHAALLEELLGSVSPDESGDWRARLASLLRSYADLLFSYPGLARSALVLRPFGPNAVLLYDRVLGLLLEGGIPAEQAAWGVDLLLQYVTGTAAEHSTPDGDDLDAPADDEAEMDALSRALHSADPATAPHVAAHADALLSGTPEARISWALHALIEGIATTPTAHRS